MATSPDHDVLEKSLPSSAAVATERDPELCDTPKIPAPSFLRRMNDKIENLSGFEARGIARVPPEDRQPASRSADLQVFLLWLSANTTLNNLTVGMLGPLVLGLGFLDCALLAVFGAFFGAVTTAYMSTFGPQSGNRTMVVARFFMGYWPAKIPTLLNIVLMVGYGTIDCILGGQVLSAVSGGSMTIIVGIVVVAIVAAIVVMFGMAIFHKYERFAWLPQFIVLFVLIGVAGPHFDASAPSVADSPSILAANRLSFFCLCLYVPNSWAAAASDFYVYYPERTSKVKIFSMTLMGLWLAFSFVYLIAIGLSTGIANNPSWSAANDVSTGALLVEAYNPLGGFGRFCAVVVALGVIANNIPGTYSAALGCQMLGRYGKAVPRWVWGLFLILIQLVLGVAGREHLFVIFQNFLALMGYWVMIMICIILQEHLIFRRGKSFDWSRWDDRSYLPIGWAAFAAFLLGWVGAVLGMSQVWYVGPLAQLASAADVGVWIGCGFSLVTFPVMRYFELKFIGK